MSQRLAPQTSEISIGAILPRKMEASQEETREMRLVWPYAWWLRRWKRRIWGPVKRWGVLAWVEGIGRREEYVVRFAAGYVGELLFTSKIFVEEVTLLLGTSILPIRAEGVRESMI